MDEHNTTVGKVNPHLPEKEPYMYGHFERWTIGLNPICLEFQDPTATQLENPPKQRDSKVVVILANPSPKSCDWVYMVAIGQTGYGVRNKTKGAPTEEIPGR